MKDPEEKKEKAENQVAVDQNAAHSTPVKKVVEISEESKQERMLLAGMLLQQTEDLVQKDKIRKQKKASEIIELRSGYKFSLAELHKEITAILQPYSPMFPNSVPFFSEIYRLNGWKDLDPKCYVKPAVVATWINELIYGRFGKDAVPALKVLNPAFSTGFRMHKHFQYLTAEGKTKLAQYRDEAIAIMQKSSTWIEFRQRLLADHGVPYQMSIFEK
jgi:hypothetical protein